MNYNGRLRTCKRSWRCSRPSSTDGKAWYAENSIQSTTAHSLRTQSLKRRLIVSVHLYEHPQLPEDNRYADLELGTEYKPVLKNTIPQLLPGKPVDR